MKKAFCISVLFTSLVSASDTLTVDIQRFPPNVILGGVKPTGFDIELFEWIANDIGLDYKYREIKEFSKLHSNLKDGIVDITVAGVTITSEREKYIDFSYPYLSSGLSILVKKKGTVDVLKVIKRKSKEPIKFLVNTHHHEDHIGGNAPLAKDGTIIFSHENVRNRLIGVRNKNKDDSKKFDAKALPIITISEDLTFYFNNEKIMVFHIFHQDGLLRSGRMLTQLKTST